MKQRNKAARSPYMGKGHAHRPKTRDRRGQVKARLKKNPEGFSVLLSAAAGKSLRDHLEATRHGAHPRHQP